MSQLISRRLEFCLHFDLVIVRRTGTSVYAKVKLFVERARKLWQNEVCLIRHVSHSEAIILQLELQLVVRLPSRFTFQLLRLLFVNHFLLDVAHVFPVIVRRLLIVLALLDALLLVVEFQ